MNESLPKVYLVRHGETAWTLTGQHTGRTDIPLTAAGERQAETLAVHLRGLEVALILSSPLVRARHTAELAGFGERLEAVDDLMEWDYGAYEGRRTADLRAERPGWRLFDDGCPDGETVDDLGKRADRVIARIRAHGDNALVFAHRDILRVLMARWLALPPLEGRRFQLSTASISIVGYDHDLEEPVLRLLNEVRR